MLLEKKWKILLLASCFLAVFSSCSSYPEKAVRAIGGYAKARGTDFSDAFELRVEAGPGFDVKIHYALGVWGLGWSAGAAKESPPEMLTTYWWRLGKGTGTLRSTTISPMPIPIVGGVTIAIPEGLCGEPMNPGAWPWFWTKCPASLLVTEVGIERIQIHGDKDWGYFFLGPLVLEGPGGPMHPKKTIRKAFPLGGRLFCLCGLTCRVYPVEVVDFLVGFAGLNLTKDFPREESD